LDKVLGVRPVGIGSIFHRIFAKCVIEAIGSEATAACGNLLSYEGAIHAVHETFVRTSPRVLIEPPEEPDDEPTEASATDTTDANNASTDSVDMCDEGPSTQPLLIPEKLEGPIPEGLLLINASNGFNKLVCKAMLWTVRHRWANGSWFSFNGYRHAGMLLLHWEGEAREMISWEGIMQVRIPPEPPRRVPA
jgi:hypothetical protein